MKKASRMANTRTPAAACLPISGDEKLLIESLKHGDEKAFGVLVEQHHHTLVHLAMNFVSSREIAEEAVQETWFGVFRGIHRFAGCSSLKTWIFRILINRAKTKSKQESGYVLCSAWGNRLREEAVELPSAPARLQAIDQTCPGHWAIPPCHRCLMPEDQVLWQETQACLQGEIEKLSPGQRAVIILRDVEGWTSEEVCVWLAINQTHQRVLLHRARAKVKRALEHYFQS